MTPRRETSLCAKPIGSRDINQRERRADALGTLAWVAQQLQADKLPVELNAYEGAVHDFDNPVGVVKERKEIPSRLHAGRGVMAGANPAMREKA